MRIYRLLFEEEGLAEPSLDQTRKVLGDLCNVTG
jgi:hypothetical protein